MMKRNIIAIAIFISLIALFSINATIPDSGNIVLAEDFDESSTWPSSVTVDDRAELVIPVNVVRIYSDKNSAESFAPEKWVKAQVEIANKLFRYSDREMGTFKKEPAPCLQFTIHKFYDVHEDEVSDILGKELDTESLLGSVSSSSNSFSLASTNDLRTLKVTESTTHLTLFFVHTVRDPLDAAYEWGGESNVGFSARSFSGPKRILTKVTGNRAYMGVIIARSQITYMSTVAHEIGHYFGLPHAWYYRDNANLGITDLGTGPQGDVDQDVLHGNIMDYERGNKKLYYSKSQLRYMYNFASTTGREVIEIKFREKNEVPIPETIAPEASFSKLWTTVADSGVTVHSKFQVSNLLNQEGEYVAWFYDSNDNPLWDTDKTFFSSDGQVALAGNYTPAYKKAVFNDFALEIPGDQLHLLPGKHNLKVQAGLFYKGSLLSTSDRIPFTYTVPGAPESESQVAGWITELRVKPAETWKGSPAVMIDTDFTADYLKGKELWLEARFFFSDGRQLYDFDQSFGDSDGFAMTNGSIVLKYERTNVTQMKIYMPHKEFHLTGGTSTLFAKVNLRYGKQIIANGTTDNFSITVPFSQEASFKDIRVLQGESLKFEFDFNIKGAKDKEITLVAWFWTAYHEPLYDFDKQYYSSDGQVSTWDTDTPIYDNTNFTDFTLTLPYSQLHLKPGGHDLELTAGIFCDGKLLVSTAEPVYFSVEY